MPVYNVDPYLKESIESVLNQTFADFELIIVNDGSTDRSGEILNKFASSDYRIRVLHKANGGQSSARNLGLEFANGTYVYFIDSDDTISPNLLKKAYEVIKKEAIDIFTFTGASFIDPKHPPEEELDTLKSTEYILRNYLPEGKLSSLEYFEKTSAMQNFVVAVWLFVIKREVIKNNNLLFFEGIIYEDELFSRQLFLAAKNVYFLKLPLYNRRLRFESTTTSKVSLKKPSSFLIVAEELYKIYNNLGNKYLLQRSENLYRRAIISMLDFPFKPKGYNKVLKNILASKLKKIFKVDLGTVLHLHFKEIKHYQNKWTTVRYNLGLRTRLKNILKSK